VFNIGPYVFRPSARLLIERTSGRKMRLTSMETAILKFLYRAGGEPTPRQMLSTRCGATTAR
jgi:DNA-binding winged helix-turn-helix (wHTH) protein